MGNRGGGHTVITRLRDGSLSGVSRKREGERLRPGRERCAGNGTRERRGPQGSGDHWAGGKRLQQKGDVVSDRDTRLRTTFNTLPLCAAAENHHALRNVKVRILRHLSRRPHVPTRARGRGFLDARPVGAPPSPECPAPAEKASGSPEGGGGVRSHPRTPAGAHGRCAGLCKWAPRLRVDGRSQHAAETLSAALRKRGNRDGWGLGSSLSPKTDTFHLHNPHWPGPLSGKPLG